MSAKICRSLVAMRAEAKVPAYSLPDPLRFVDGTPVRDARDWTDRRRAEVLRLFETHVYGRSPAPPQAAICPSWQ